ncbi:hypothetical protein JZ751_024752, partial [Albula glossodonta]
MSLYTVPRRASERRTERERKREGGRERESEGPRGRERDGVGGGYANFTGQLPGFMKIREEEWCSVTVYNSRFRCCRILYHCHLFSLANGASKKPRFSCLWVVLYLE